MGGRGRVVVRIAGVVAVLCGASVLVAVFAGRTFDRADAGERATDLVREELTVDGLRRHRADLELSRRAFDELFDDALPAIARQLGTTPEALDRRLAATYPAVGAVLDDGDRAEGLAFAERIVSNLERHRRNFEDADAIPVGWLPMTAGPWVGVAAGVAFVVAGLWALTAPGRPPVAVLAVLGLVAAVSPFAVRFPQKADSARDLLDTLNVTPAIAASTRDLLEGAAAATDELERRVYPDLADALGVSSAAFDAALGQRFPAVAEGRRQLDAVFARYERRVRIREAGLTVVPEAKQFPLEDVTWWAVVPGGLTALAAGAALVAGRRLPGPPRSPER